MKEMKNMKTLKTIVLAAVMLASALAAQAGGVRRYPRNGGIYNSGMYAWPHVRAAVNRTAGRCRRCRCYRAGTFFGLFQAPLLRSIQRDSRCL
jgi:hypothetical protein